MKSYRLVFVSALLIGFASCDKGKGCECTSSFSDGSADVVNVYETLDKTNTPDCRPYEGTLNQSRVISTITCESISL